MSRFRSVDAGKKARKRIDKQRDMDNIPNDPFMLLSYVNTRLRDDYTSLDVLCDDLDINRSELEAKLHGAGFDYMPAINQFR